MNIQYDGASALELVRDIFPESYSIEIEIRKSLLYRLQGQLQCSFIQAYEYAMASDPKKIESLLLFVATYQLELEAENTNTQLVNSVRLLEQQRLQYLKQLNALRLKNFKNEHIISGYYNRRIRDFNNKITATVKQFNTINPIYIKES